MSLSSSAATPSGSAAVSSSSSSSVPLLTSAAASGSSVSIDDESTTKRCSQCSEDRPTSDFSSAQLKKKGKRVCQRCVAKKDAAALAQKAAESRAAAVARKDGMKSAFSARLNATATHAAAPCLCCEAMAIRFATCIRCTVECCSLSCFDHHDCDAYLEAARTIPTTLIAQEDQFANFDEILSSWKEMSCYLRSIPESSPDDAVERCRTHTEALRSIDGLMSQVNHDAMSVFYAPRVVACWWSPELWDRHHTHGDVQRFIVSIVSLLWPIGDSAVRIFEDCAGAHHPTSEAELFRGSSRPRATIDRISACLLPGRLTHKMLTFVLFVLRAMPRSWVEKLGYPEQPRPQIDSDAFGLLPCCIPDLPSSASWRLGYLQHIDPITGLRTLLMTTGTSTPTCRFSLLQHHFGDRLLVQIVQDGVLSLDRGLLVSRSDIGTFFMTAVSGWNGNLSSSFLAAPIQLQYFPTDMIQGWFTECIDKPEAKGVLVRELELRKQSSYFHIVPAIKSMLAENEWPNLEREMLFISTPQLGIESELVELSLLEALVEEAAAGDQHARLLLTHIEEECAAPIAEVIAAQKSRLDQMLEDQAEQLRIHAEAVKRAELRGRIKATAVEGSDEGASSDASASSSASASALAPISAASASASSSSTAVTSSASGSAASAVFESAVAYSWTQFRAYTSLADLCTAGRKKYSTIMSAALRFLHTLRPVSVNRSGGSHTVFHFASGSPVTLVTPHGGDGSISRHAATRLYAVMHEAALQQLHPTQAIADGAAGGGAGRARLEA